MVLLSKSATTPCLMISSIFLESSLSKVVCRNPSFKEGFEMKVLLEEALLSMYFSISASASRLLMNFDSSSKYTSLFLHSEDSIS